MLDEKNKIIFEHLLEHARFPIKKLATLIRSSQPAVIKRIRHLESKGYISRYDAIINWQKIKLIKKIYFLKVNPRDYEKAINNLREQHPIFSIIKLSGLYNLQIWCFFKTKKQIKEFEKIIKQNQSRNYEIKKLEIIGDSFFDTERKLTPPPIVDKELILKPVDIKIMKHLAQGHGRDSLLKVSNELKLPYDKINRHTKQLIKSGYFSKIIAQPGESKFTLQTTALTINFNKNNLSKEIYEKIASKSKIRSIALLENNSLMVHFFSLDFEDYQEKLNEILTTTDKENISSMSIAHWTKIVINNRYPLEFLLKIREQHH